jgi:hypothetical protein
LPLNFARFNFPFETVKDVGLCGRFTPPRHAANTQ